MTNLEKIILSFDQWSYPWTFYEFVLNNPLLDKDSKLLFEKIWKEAGKFELWNYCDLVLGCKCCQQFIRENYELDEKAIANVVRSLSYEWR